MIKGRATVGPRDFRKRWLIEDNLFHVWSITEADFDGLGLRTHLPAAANGSLPPSLQFGV